MAKAVIKTAENEASVDAFIATQKDEEVRADCRTIIKLMSAATGEKPKMWGASMVGFGSQVYTSPATGRQVDWMICGFSPRKANLSIHLMTGTGSAVRCWTNWASTAPAKAASTSSAWPMWMRRC